MFAYRNSHGASFVLNINFRKYIVCIIILLLYFIILYIIILCMMCCVLLADFVECMFDPCVNGENH